MASDPIRGRFTFLMVFCVVLAGTLVSRAAWIQIVRDERIEKLSRPQFSTRVLVSPRRGTILDRNGEPLAINAETRSLAMNPQRSSTAETWRIFWPKRSIFRKAGYLAAWTIVVASPGSSGISRTTSLSGSASFTSSETTAI